MATVLTSVFSCCLSRKSSRSRILDEESHLIPANTEIETSDTSIPDVVILQQEMKDRMLHVVRVKESKMVNVASPMPFNLHNKALSQAADEEGSGKLAGPSSSFSPSFSRSVSAASLPPSVRFHNHRHHVPPSPLSPLSPIHQNQNHAPTYRAAPTISRSSSMAFRSEQDQSINDEYAENEEEDRSHSGSGSRGRFGAQLKPAFNIRLVRGLPLRSQAEAPGTRRGRAKKKKAEGSGGTGDSPGSGGHSSRQGNGNGTALDSRSPENPGSADTMAGATPIARPLVGPQGECVTTGPALSVSPASTFASEFALRESGPLVIGWDD